MVLYKRDHFFANIARLSPVISILLFLFYIIFQKTESSLYLLIILSIMSCSNIFIKNYISRPIYRLIPGLNNIIQGTRPNDAMSCSLVLDGELGSRTFGMPSGHSQIIWSIVVYILFKLWYTKYYNNKTIKLVDYIIIINITIVLLGYAIYVSYSRVYIEGCHTLLQVIIGGLIGMLISSIIIIYELRNNYKN
jgi:membrane-associated phospholipid phosphatase